MSDVKLAILFNLLNVRFVACLVSDMELLSYELAMSKRVEQELKQRGLI
jgi:hypothetical protein